MSKLTFPNDYLSPLSLRETQIAIKTVKDFFEYELSKQLNLLRVTAPLFVATESGINDNLNGIERPVTFSIMGQENKKIEVIHSLAKWKRIALQQYEFNVGEGLYTDMNAIRRDEEIDNIHSLYVDQWDWEVIISKEERTRDYLELMANKIYKVIKITEDYMSYKYDYIRSFLPESLKCITTQELEEKYPNCTPKEREYKIVRTYGAVFIEQIGDILKSGEKHDNRAPDYDDWKLNGDILVYYPVLDIALELSSMGIRVDSASLRDQLIKSGCIYREKYFFQKMLLEGKLPLTVGGGIGQSRMYMFFLRKAHIGEVQCSIWPYEVREKAKSHNIILL